MFATDPPLSEERHDPPTAIAPEFIAALQVEEPTLLHDSAAVVDVDDWLWSYEASDERLATKKQCM